MTILPENPFVPEKFRIRLFFITHDDIRTTIHVHPTQLCFALSAAELNCLIGYIYL